jgi:hypothetical protein
MSQTIPTLDDPFYTIRVRLDEADYTLEFYYSTRQERTYLHLYDAEDNPLVLGLKMVPNVRLLRAYKHRAGMPAGELMVVCASADQEPPVLGELGLLDDGKRCSLVYYPAAELAELELD